MKNKSIIHGITILKALPFFTLLFFHLFISQEQKDLLYFFITIAYLIYRYGTNNMDKLIFRDTLILILISPIFLIVKLNNVATILMDYVFVFLCIGLIFQAIKILKENI